MLVQGDVSDVAIRKYQWDGAIQRYEPTYERWYQIFHVLCWLEVVKSTWLVEVDG